MAHTFLPKKTILIRAFTTISNVKSNSIKYNVSRYGHYSVYIRIRGRISSNFMRAAHDSRKLML